MGQKKDRGCGSSTVPSLPPGSHCGKICTSLDLNLLFLKWKCERFRRCYSGPDLLCNLRFVLTFKQRLLRLSEEVPGFNGMKITKAWRLRFADGARENRNNGVIAAA